MDASIDSPLSCVVSMSTVRYDSFLNHYNLLTVSLAALTAILLAVDIGLGVYCKLFLTHNNVDMHEKNIMKVSRNGVTTELR